MNLTRQVKGLVSENFKTLAFCGMAIKTLLVICRYAIRYLPYEKLRKFIWHVFVHKRWKEERLVRLTTLFGASMLVDAREIVGRYIYYFGVWEPNLTNALTSILHPGDVMIDVGAHVGYFSLLAALRVGMDGAVFAIEPSPLSSSILKYNVALNRLRNVHVITTAAWSGSSGRQFYLSFDGVANGVCTMLKKRARQWRLTRSIFVETNTIAALVPASLWHKIRFIKVDVEGAEWEVLQGMALILRNCADQLQILIEISYDPRSQNHVTIWEYMHSMGFIAYVVNNDYSANSYISKQKSQGVWELISLPEHFDQLDILFSRFAL